MDTNKTGAVTWAEYWFWVKNRLSNAGYSNNKIQALMTTYYMQFKVLSRQDALITKADVINYVKSKVD